MKEHGATGGFASRSQDWHVWYLFADQRRIDAPGRCVGALDEAEVPVHSEVGSWCTVHGWRSLAASPFQCRADYRGTPLARLLIAVAVFGLASFAVSVHRCATLQELLKLTGLLGMFLFAL